MPTARVGAIDLVYEERGAGEPLLLCSGLGMSLVGWPDGFLDRLAARGHRVIVFDNRDAGLSTQLDGATIPPLRRLVAHRLLGRPIAAPYTLFDLAADAVGLLDHLALARAHVVGVSMGGMIAQAMAIVAGERVASLTSMMSFSGNRLLPGRPAAMLRLLRRPAPTREAVVAAQLAFFRAAGSTGFRRDEAALAERAGRAFDRAYRPRGFARQFAAVLATGDLRPRLASVRVPTLVLHGAVDGIMRPVCARETARAIPGATLRLVPGWGHDLPEGAWPILVDEIAAHLARTGSPGDHAS